MEGTGTPSLCPGRGVPPAAPGVRDPVADLLHEDLLIRDLVKKNLKDAAVPEVLIERYANR